MNATAHPEGKAALTFSGRLHDGNKRRGSNTILTMRAIIRHSNVGQLNPIGQACWRLVGVV
jgi:hypothetical protein